MGIRDSAGWAFPTDRGCHRTFGSEDGGIGGYVLRRPLRCSDLLIVAVA